MPSNSSALVTRLLNANGVVLGKTRMHELALGATTINPNGGPVLNPYNNRMHVGVSPFVLLSLLHGESVSPCNDRRKMAC